MKVALVVLVIALALCQANAGFRGRGFRGGLGFRRGLGFRGGLGFRRGFGFGGLGFGGFGLGLGLGLPWGMPWGLGLGPFGLIGKRDVENVEEPVEETEEHFNKMAKEITHCTYEHDMIKCHGHKDRKFECEVEPNFTTYEETRTHHYKNLTALPENIEVKDDKLIFNLFSFDKNTEEINDYTFLEKVKGKEDKFFFSMFFKGEAEEDINTFRFTSGTCWNKFVNTVRTSMPGNVRFTLKFHESE